MLVLTSDNRGLDEKQQKLADGFLVSMDHLHKEDQLWPFSECSFRYSGPGSGWPNSNLWGKTQELHLCNHLYIFTSASLPKPFQHLQEVSKPVLIGWETRIYSRGKGKAQGAKHRSLADSLRAADITHLIPVMHNSKDSLEIALERQISGELFRLI